MPASDWYERHSRRFAREAAYEYGDVSFYVELAQRYPPALELGSGDGRVALAIALAGVSVTGLERAQAMLALARERTPTGASVRWTAGDMRAFDLRERFGLVCIPFRGAQHLLTESDQRSALACCRRHLLPGGRLALDLYHPPAGLLTLLRARAGDERDVAISRAVRGRPVRLMSRAEVETLLRRSGFVPEAVYGGFNGEPVLEESTTQVWIARPSA